MKNIVQTKALSLLLCLAMLLSLVPAASLTAFAGEASPYADLKNTTTAITFDNKQWYLIDYDSTTVTLLSKECVGASKFGSKNTYSGSTVETAVNNYYTNNISADAKAAVNGNGMFLLTTAQANAMTTDQRKCAQASGVSANCWWLCSAGKFADRAACVAGGSGYIDASFSYVHHVYGVRPALKLDLSKVEFNSETTTFSVASSHEHDFTYSANGATITATCTADGCPLENSKISFTLVAPAVGETGLVYDGTNKKATLEGVDAFNTATGMNISADDIVYNYKAKSSDSSVVVTETKNAGIYQALYTLQTDFPRPVLSTGFTINKATPTYTVPTGLTATCGQTLKDITLPTGWSWATNTQSVGGVGTNTFKATFTPTDTTNYNTISDIEVKVTVSKAADKKAYINTDTMTYNDTTIYIEGVVGQEYVIIPKGTPITDSDWEKSIKPDPERENWVFFENLKEATEYEIYTRTAETETAFASDPVKANVYTTLSSIGLDYDSTLVGATVKVMPEPEVEGLTYKWYQDVATEDGEGAIHHDLTEITGAAGDTYTFRTEDIGKGITVKIFAGKAEVGDIEIEGPVTLTATVYFDSMGGSDVKEITDVEYRAKIEAPKDPIRKGYAFAGWYWEEEYLTPFDFQNDLITWENTTLYAKWTPVNYSITSVTGLSGANEKQWAKGTKDGVVITVKVSGEDNSFDHFIGVKLDGKDLVKDVDYTVEKGSTIVTLKPETLEKLSVGEHTVTVLFDNGEVNTTLTVLAANSQDATSPQTGDNSHLGLWIALMMFSLLGIAATLLFGRKKRVFDR